MTFYHGKNADLFIDKYRMSPYLQGVTLDITRGLATFEGLQTTAVQRVAGHLSARITVEGMAFTAESHTAAWNTFSDADGWYWSFLPFGMTRGALALVGQALHENIGYTAGDDIVRIPLGAASTNSIDIGHVLRGPADTTSPSASVDFVTGSANGGIAYVNFYGGTGGVTVTFEDSPDEATWTPIVTIDLSSSGFAVSATEVSGSIDRYLRVSWTQADSPLWVAVFCMR